MACCFACFYDTSTMDWDEHLLAEAIVKAAEAASMQPKIDHDHPVEALDFRSEVTLDEFLFPAGGRKLRITDYAPRVFRYMREDPAFGNNISHEDWLDEWTKTKNQPSKGELGSGKSGATFVPSIHGHYLIKTIDKKEAEMQVRILADYMNYSKQNKNSLLMRILNLLRIEELENERDKVGTTKYLVVAESVDDVPKALKMQLLKWDLKGRVPKPGKLPHPGRVAGGIRKDKDLLRDFRLTPTAFKQVINQLMRDTRYLKRHNLMDYSLFICAAQTALPLDQRKKLISLTTPAGGIPTASLRSVLKASHNSDLPDLHLREQSQRCVFLCVFVCALH